MAAPILAYVTNLYTVPLFPPNELEFGLRTQVLVFHRSQDLLAYLRRYYETIQSNSHFTQFHLPMLFQSDAPVEEILNGINIVNYYIPLHSRLRYSGISVESVIVNNQLLLPDPDYTSGHFTFDIGNEESLQFFMDLLQPNIHYRDILYALQETEEAEQRKSTSLSRQVSSPTSSSLQSISEEEKEEGEVEKAAADKRIFHNTPPDQMLFYTTTSTASGAGIESPPVRFSRPSPIKATSPSQRSSPFQSMLNWFNRSRHARQ